MSAGVSHALPYIAAGDTETGGILLGLKKRVKHLALFLLFVCFLCVCICVGNEVSVITGEDVPLKCWHFHKRQGSPNCP